MRQNVNSCLFFSNLGVVVREAKVTNVRILEAKEVLHLSGAGDLEPIHHVVAQLVQEEVPHHHEVVGVVQVLIMGEVGGHLVVVWGYPRDTVSIHIDIDMLDTIFFNI